MLLYIMLVHLMLLTTLFNVVSRTFITGTYYTTGSTEAKQIMCLAQGYRVNTAALIEFEEKKRLNYSKTTTASQPPALQKIVFIHIQNRVFQYNRFKLIF